MPSRPASRRPCSRTYGSQPRMQSSAPSKRRWNIVGGDGMTVRLPLVVGFARAMELIITGRRIDVREAERIGLVNEIVPTGEALERAQELAHQIASLPQGAIRSDKESMLRGIGR